MKNIKRKKLLLISLFFLFITTLSYSSELLITVSIDWTLGIRGGIEYRFNRYSGIRGDIGISMVQIPSASLSYVLYLLPEDKKMRLNLLFGIPNFILPFEVNPFRPYPMISFGGSFLIGYKFTDSISTDFRIGGGFPLFLGEKDKPIVRPFLRLPIPGSKEVFPLYLFPDLAASVNFRLK